MRLMGTIIVALLAITMAIFPVTVPQAAASAGHQHAIMIGAGHEHASVDGEHEHVDELVSSDGTTQRASTDHHQSSKDCSGPVCCSMGTCHAVQVSAPTGVYSPTVSQASMIMAGDRQVGGLATGGPDRPPRTV